MVTGGRICRLDKVAVHAEPELGSHGGAGPAPPLTLRQKSIQGRPGGGVHAGRPVTAAVCGNVDWAAVEGVVDGRWSLTLTLP